MPDQAAGRGPLYELEVVAPGSPGSHGLENPGFEDCDLAFSRPAQTDCSSPEPQESIISVIVVDYS